jgi:SNF2 family DNA or RNA helicase
LSLSIVFSAWKITLELVGELLAANNIGYHIIKGDLSLNKRLKVLSDFKSPFSANILLMTLGTGAVGCVRPATSKYLVS